MVIPTVFSKKGDNSVMFFVSDATPYRRKGKNNPAIW